MTYRRRSTKPTPLHLARLNQDLHTPLGILPAGATVIILDAGARFARACLDGGLHLTGRCHTSRVPVDWLDHDPNQATHLDRSTAA